MVRIEGRLPKAIGLSRKALLAAAEFFAAKGARRAGAPFRSVTVILQDDTFSAETHLAINGAEGPTDVTTQRYDPMPGEKPGIYGELYVNADRAAETPARNGWSAAKELLLYVAHGMDHLSGADDALPRQYSAMRRRELRWLAELPPEEDCGRRIEVIARGVCVQDGKVLLCRPRKGGYAYLPGGHVEFGETSREALVREMKEETGLDASAGELLGAVETSFEQRGAKHCEVSLVYRMSVPARGAKTVRAKEGWISFTWCPVTELGRVNLLPREMAGLVRGKGGRPGCLRS